MKTSYLNSSYSSVHIVAVSVVNVFFGGKKAVGHLINCLKLANTQYEETFKLHCTCIETDKQ